MAPKITGEAEPVVGEAQTREVCTRGIGEQAISGASRPREAPNRGMPTSSVDRCDEILRLIDETLGAVEPPASRVPVSAIRVKLK